jgi:hypothetical protein
LWFLENVRKAAATAPVPPDFLRFACYIAVCNMKYGPSYASVTAKEIFDCVSDFGSDLPAGLKKDGSGELPKNVTEYKNAEVSCKANDAFATVKISLKTESEENYAQVLDFLCRLLGHEFPRSYAIAFRSPEKHYLPVKGLPKKGVHRLFANAARYPALYGKIEDYARLAMHEYEWYNDLEGEDCAMPGSFAVFALGLAEEKYATLVLEYLKLCDGEHSSVQGKFLPAFVEKYGLGETGMRVFLAGAASVQELPPNKIYAEAAEGEDSLRLLLAAKDGMDEYLWENAIYALWGDDAINARGARTVKAAPSARANSAGIPICRRVRIGRTGTETRRPFSRRSLFPTQSPMTPPENRRPKVFFGCSMTRTISRGAMTRSTRTDIR